MCKLLQNISNFDSQINPMSKYESTISSRKSIKEQIEPVNLAVGNVFSDDPFSKLDEDQLSELENAIQETQEERELILWGKKQVELISESVDEQQIEFLFKQIFERQLPIRFFLREDVSAVLKDRISEFLYKGQVPEFFEKIPLVIIKSEEILGALDHFLLEKVFNGNRYGLEGIFLLFEKYKFTLTAETKQALENSLIKMGCVENINSIDLVEIQKFIKLFSVSEESVKKIIKIYLIHHIEQRNFIAVKNILTGFSIGKSFLDDVKILEKAQEEYKEILKGYHLFNNDYLENIRNLFNLPSSFFENVEIQQLARKKIGILISNGMNLEAEKEIALYSISKDDLCRILADLVVVDNYGFINIIEKNIQDWSIPENLQNHFICLIIAGKLEKGHLVNAKQIKTFFSISDEIIFTPEFKLSASSGFLNCLLYDIEKSKEIIELYNFSIEEVQNLVQEYIIGNFSNIGSKKVLELIKTFNISDIFLLSQKFQDVAIEGLCSEINSEFVQESGVKEMITFFKLSDEKVKEIVEKVIVEGSGYLRLVKRISTMFSVSKDFLSTPEVIESAKKFIGKIFVDNNSFENVDEIAKFYSISNEDVNFIAADVIITVLEGDNLSRIFKISEFIKEVDILELPKVRIAIQSSFVRLVEGGNLDMLFYYINSFPIPSSIFNSGIVLGAVKKCLTKLLSYNIERAVELMSVFPTAAKTLLPSNIVEALRDSLWKLSFFSNGSKESILNFVDQFSVPSYLVVEESSQFLINNFNNVDKINTFLSNSLPEKYNHDVLVSFMSRIMVESRWTNVEFTNKDTVKNFFNKKFPGLVDDDLLFESGMQACMEPELQKNAELRSKICGSLDITKEHIIDYTLANKNHDSFQDINITAERLDNHFSDHSNCTTDEYARIYAVFRPYDYYRQLLNKISSGDVKIRLGILTVMGECEIDKNENYLWVKDQVLLLCNNLSTPLSKMFSETLGRFIKAGDTELSSYCLGLVRNKIKNIPTEGEDVGALGLSSLQELALRTLLNSGDNLAINEVYSLIINGNLLPRVKFYILKKVLVNDSGHLTENYSNYISDELANLKDKFNWKNLRFMSAIRLIPSLDVKAKIIDLSDRAFENENFDLSLLDNKFSNIPDESMLAIYNIVGGDENNLHKINILYSKMNTLQKSSFLFDIANLQVVPQNIRDYVFSLIPKISEIKIIDIDGFDQLVRKIIFLYQMKDRLTLDGGELQNIIVSLQEIEQLNESLGQIISNEMKKLLPHHKINGKLIIDLIETWGTIDPILVYANKMHDYFDMKKYLAEIVANMSGSNWKMWRYDTQRKNVNMQIKSLDKKQLSYWQDDIFVETNDILMLSTPSDKPQQIANWLAAAAKEGHLDEVGANSKYSAIQRTFSNIIEESEVNMEKKQEFVNSKILELKDDMSLFDILILSNDIKKLEGIVLQFTSNSNITINSKLKNSISFLVRFLSKEDQEEVLKNYKQIDENSELVEKDGQKKVSPSKILSNNHLLSIKKVISDINNKKEELMKSDKLVKYGFYSDADIDLKKLFSKRNEIKVIYDLCRLSVVDIKNIVFNTMEKNVGKESGEEMSVVIKNLLNYFKDCPSFIQDLENIKLLIEKNDSVISSKKRRLAFMITDDPQVLMQIGKYPIGCGSCQNYEGSPELNRSLLGYVGDAHTKASYLIDLNKLPEVYCNQIEQDGFEAVKNKIPKQVLLEASLARSVLKFVNIKDVGPAIFVEPIYTSLNKADNSQDNLFEQTILYSLAKPMGISIVRGEGKEIALVPASANPQGQYEDCAAGNAGHGGMGIRRGAYAMSARLI